MDIMMPIPVLEPEQDVEEPQRNCPFYGYSLVHYWAPPFVLVGTGGNQCAIVTSTHSPCYLEKDSQPVDWRACKRISERQRKL